MQEAIGKDYLPTEYGGFNGSLAEGEESYEKLLLSYKTYFDEDGQYGVDETLRQGGSTSSSQGGSSFGSFRKLLFID